MAIYSCVICDKVSKLHFQETCQTLLNSRVRQSLTESARVQQSPPESSRVCQSLVESGRLQYGTLVHWTLVDSVCDKMSQFCYIL